VSAATRKWMRSVTWSPKWSAFARSRATASNHGHQTVPAGYSGTVSWLAAESQDQWPVAKASSVGNVAASHRFHYRADREMHLPEVLGWTVTEGMGPWC